MRVGIVGCGLIGKKRAESIGRTASITVCCDLDVERAQALASAHHADATGDWRAAVARSDVDVIVVCVTHDLLAEIAASAVSYGKHVLIEKPGARRAAELDQVCTASQRTGALVRIGLNHRYHRAALQAKDICDSGVLSDLMFVRGRYGHGGRPGYEREWRFMPERSGGGEAIDQGMHLIDLASWFLGDLKLICGRAPNYFWDGPVEDNAFLLLETSSKQVAFLHASWTEWKNLFSIEIAGRKGKLELTGLGGSYGTERLTHYQMLPEMGPPQTTIYEYPMPDNSWEMEWADFMNDIRLRRRPEPGIKEAQAALMIIEQLYSTSRP